MTWKVWKHFYSKIERERICFSNTKVGECCFLIPPKAKTWKTLCCMETFRIHMSNIVPFYFFLFLLLGKFCVYIFFEKNLKRIWCFLEGISRKVHVNFLAETTKVHFISKLLFFQTFKKKHNFYWNIVRSAFPKKVYTVHQHVF